MNLRYKARALRHLEQIHSYIAKDDPAAASRVVVRIAHSIGRLSRFPWSGLSLLARGFWLCLGFPMLWSIECLRSSSLFSPYCTQLDVGAADFVPNCRKGVGSFGPTEKGTVP